MKRIKIILALLTIGFWVLLMAYIVNKEMQSKTEVMVFSTEITYDERVLNVEKPEIPPYELALIRMEEEMSELENITDRKEWYLAYKDIVFKYVKWFDPPETVFNYFTEDEVKLICNAVETECYQQDFDSKCNVASVIFNRYYSGEFGDTIEKVITTENQFSYGRNAITEETMLAVMYSWEIEDTTDGCVAFRSGDKPEKWYTTETRYWAKQFEDNSGHAFYK